jgi:hypothetical protein
MENCHHELFEDRQGMLDSDQITWDRSDMPIHMHAANKNGLFLQKFPTTALKEFGDKCSM